MLISQLEMDRFNIGRDVRELKLGTTFGPQSNQNAFHTLKYDFKPASVDLSKVASLDVSSNNQVTVTVPNIESSGVPNTVFKGNQRKYTKECLIIFDRKTGVMTLEKLNHNIQVKKTRSGPTNKNIAPTPHKAENNTQRTSSKTRVSTGVRKNGIIGYVPRSSPMEQSSPSYTTTHRSPQNAPAWNANNAQSTLPNIPFIGIEEDVDMQINSRGSSMVANQNTTNNLDFEQPQKSYHQNNNLSANNLVPRGKISHVAATSSIASNATSVENEIGVLSSSDSSSDSDSSGSGSDSDDSAEQNEAQNLNIRQINNRPENSNHLNHHRPPYENGSLPALLHDDLQLSESNSSDSDDD